MSLEVYRSSAGSGKTTTLVRRFLSIVLASDQPDEFRNVLAITFTNKAAGEMKERILQALNELGNSNGIVSESNRAWAAEFCKTNKLTKEQLQGRAAATLSRILHRYSEFSVSTIDKFSHRIIRQFAFDLGISSDFRVELDADALIEEAVQRVINKAGEDPMLTRFLVAFIVNKADDEKGWNIEQDIAGLGKKLFDEASDRPIKLLRNLSLDDFLELRKNLLRDTTVFLDALAEKAREVIDFASANGLAIEDFSYGASHGFLRLIERIGQGEIDILSDRRLGKFVDGEGFFNKANLKQVRFNMHIAKLSKYAEEIVDFFEAHADDYFRKMALLPTLYALGSLIEIDRALKEISADENLVHISEFNRLISSTIKDQPAPYIYERLGEKYKFIFIDEFQDTSSMQWQNLIPLVDHILASGGSAMLVGDAKQSIYRWRGGEAEQFRILPQVPGNDRLAAERSHAFAQAFSLKTLDNNHRSAPQIVAFNNAFFEHIKSAIKHAWLDVYADVSQNPKSNIDAGAVWIQPLEEAKKLIAAESAELVLKAVLDFIHLTLEKHHTRLKDITILTRNGREGSEIAAFLLGEGIPVVSPESILINRSQKVNALLSGLAYLVNSSDGPSALTWLYADHEAPLIAHEMPQPGDAFLQIKGNFFKSDSPSAVLHALCKLKKWSPLNDIFLQFFFDRVADYEINAQAPSCHAFLHWWAEHEHAFNVVLPDGMDAVQVMTVHKSKGLQFPVVIFPFFDFDTSLKNDTLLWAETNPDETCGLPAGLINQSAGSSDFIKIVEAEKSKVLLDSLNLLYVALTRACNHLVLIPSYPKNGTSSVISGWLEAFLFSHPPHHQVNSWLVFGHPDAALRAKNSEPQSASRQDIHMFGFAAPAWAKPEYSFSENVAALNKGIHMHEQLSLLAHGAEVLSEEVNRIWQGLTSHPELNPAFSQGARLFPEREICAANGEILRPDLLIENNNLFYIIDYKTGTREPEHALQVMAYTNAMTDAGFTVGGAWLVYLSETFELEKIAS